MKLDGKRLAVMWTTICLLAVSAATLTQADGSLPVRLINERPGEDYLHYTGDPVRLGLQVARECSVTVIALDSDGRVRVLWPNRHDYCNHLWPGEARSIKFDAQLLAARPGPIYVFAFATDQDMFRAHFDDRSLALLDGGPYSRQPGAPLFLPRGDGNYGLAYGVNFPRPVREIAPWEADQLNIELENAIYRDYDRFVPIVDRFLGWVFSRVRGIGAAHYGTDAVDVYVAPWEYSPASYRIAHAGYRPPTYERGGRPVVFDPFTAYGSWMNVSGMMVWKPDTWRGWRPFLYGYWVWTTHGWTWVSYEPWGDITDHYGFWAFHAQLGWIWIPGTEWRAAPVHWIVRGDDITWFPEPPPDSYRRGFSVGFMFGADLPGTRVAARFFMDSDMRANAQQENFNSRRSRERDLGEAVPTAKAPSRSVIEQLSGKPAANVALKRGDAVDVPESGGKLTPMVYEGKQTLPADLQEKLGKGKPSAPAPAGQQRPSIQQKQADKQTVPAGQYYSMPKLGKFTADGQRDRNEK